MQKRIRLITRHSISRRLLKTNKFSPTTEFTEIIPFILAEYRSEKPKSDYVLD